MEVDAILGVGRKLYVILAAYEVPHEVAHEHIAHLVVEEVGDVLTLSRLIPCVTRIVAHALRGVAILGRHPLRLILLGAAVPPHAWEEGVRLAGVDIVVEYLALLVLARVGVEPCHGLRLKLARGDILVI